MLLKAFLSLWRVGTHSNPHNNVAVTSVEKPDSLPDRGCPQAQNGRKAYHEDESVEMPQHLVEICLGFVEPGPLLVDTGPSESPESLHRRRRAVKP